MVTSSGRKCVMIPLKTCLCGFDEILWVYHFCPVCGLEIEENKDEVIPEVDGIDSPME